MTGRKFDDWLDDRAPRLRVCVGGIAIALADLGIAKLLPTRLGSREGFTRYTVALFLRDSASIR